MTVTPAGLNDLERSIDRRASGPATQRHQTDVTSAEATKAILEISGLSKRYGSVEALSEVSLDLRQGEFLTLLGPSGSGKTTLLKIIAGALSASAGMVRLNGQDITHVAGRHRGIGMVFQNFALMPHLSIFENVAFPLRIRKVPAPEIKRRVQEVLELVRLPALLERKPRELSGGQQQRVAIARALVYRPPLILMDEPLGALDKKLRQQMQLEIKRLHGSLGLSMIYVTHDQEEALTMSDRICLMGDGRIQEMGSPGEIYSRPKSVFTADFFGATNIFHGEMIACRDGAVIADERLGTIRADPGGESVPAIGQRTGWMVRPERVRLLSAGETDENVVEGMIEEVILSGQLTQLIVRVSCGAMMTVSCLTSERGYAFAKGTSVRLGWSASATMLLRLRDEAA